MIPKKNRLSRLPAKVFVRHKHKFRMVTFPRWLY